MIISERFRRLILFLLSFCLVFQALTPALVYAVDDTIFFVTGGEDRATNGGFCDDINCNFDGNLPSLEAVDSDYLEISSFLDGVTASWSNGDYSVDRYVQFNFSPGLDSSASINNPHLKLVYKTNQIDGASDFGAKMIVSADDNFDEDTDFVTTSITPDAAISDTDQSFTVDLSEEYWNVDALNNLKIRFYFFGDTSGEGDPGVTTSFNQIVLDVNQDPTLPLITVLGDDPVTIEINSTYIDVGSTAVDGLGGDISSQIVVDDSNVDTSQTGTYTVYFDVDDSDGNSAVQETRTVNVVDSIATAFAVISVNLAAPGSDIANNLNLVNTNNVSSFSGLYFEKSIDGTPVGRLTFTNTLDLSDSATQEFLQNLGSKLDQGNGRIALDATDSAIFAATGATLEMYDITSSVTSSNLVVRDDSGLVLDPLGIISGFIYDSEANKVTFNTAHFTQFDIDTTAPTKPVATPAAGDYTSAQSVILTSSDNISGVGKIYYTTDGSTPDKTKTEYTGAINVSEDLTIKAIAYDKAGNASDILEAVYGISTETSASGGIGGGGSDGRSDGLAGQTPVCNDTKPGSAPTLLSALGGINNVTLKWTEAADPLTYYLITYGTKPGAQTYGNPNVGGKGTTGYTVSGLSGGITYYFQVRAGNGCAPGDYSNEISATALGAAIATETPAEGFTPGIKGTSSDLTPAPSVANPPLAETPTPTPTATFPTWWPILLLLITGSFGVWVFFRRR